ncbi:MAG: hypothetical protein QM728_05035 [Gordonia sp. (in: high G+C Gram-positive bacteria)]|uniref:hypothetical protein n=1 Tax=Gordonia sp. (in: high G+C Gram-positive bacteria) TaxID=84139 RepID=UPI0039E57FAC
MARWVVLIAVLCGALTGCADGPDPVRIGASPDPQMQMAAVLYRGALRAQGIAVEEPVRIAGEQAQLDAMSADDLDLFPSTVPLLLRLVVPAGGTAALPKPAATEFGDADYTLLSRSLPAGVAVGDPMSGEQLVPVYRSARWDRQDLKAMNKVVGELTMPDLADLMRQWQAGKDQAALVSDWLTQHGLA